MSETCQGFYMDPYKYYGRTARPNESKGLRPCEMPAGHARILCGTLADFEWDKRRFPSNACHVVERTLNK